MILLLKAVLLGKIVARAVNDFHRSAVSDFPLCWCVVAIIERAAESLFNSYAIASVESFKSPPLPVYC